MRNCANNFARQPNVHLRLRVPSFGMAARRRGPTQPPSSAHRLRAYREGDRTIVLIPARFTRAEEAEWVAAMVQRLEAGPAAPPRRRRPAGAGAAGCPALPRRAGPPDDRRWVSNQAVALGVVHAGRRHDPDLLAGAGHAGLGARLRAAARAGPPGRARHGRDFWALLESYPRTERARGYLEGVAAAAGSEMIEDDGADDGADESAEPAS